MKCYYHNDNDGKAAAFCVHAWVGIKDCSQPVEFVEMSYGKPFPFADITENEQVWIVDYSIAPEDMDILLDITADVTWIDHHKTAIEKYAEYTREIRGVRDVSEAACTLAWKYIHWYTQRGDGEIRLGDMGDHYPYNSAHNMPIPLAIAAVGDRDTWTFALGEVSKQFHAASAMHDCAPDSEFWWKCMDRELTPLPPPNTGNAEGKVNGDIFWNELMMTGQVLMEHRRMTGTENVDSIGFRIEFEGHQCLALNAFPTNSEAFGDYGDQHDCDILMPFFHNGKRFSVSMYSKAVDVGAIAKARGGGGHKGAAGFQCDALPFLVIGGCGMSGDISVHRCIDVLSIGEHDWRCDKMNQHDGPHTHTENDAYGDGLVPWFQVSWDSTTELELLLQ